MFTPPQNCGAFVGDVLPFIITNFLTGLVPSWIDDTHIEISIGSCQSRTNPNLILTLANPTVIDFGVVGVNGLDTGAIAAAKCYALWNIRKISDGTVACIASLSFLAGGVFAPAGYTIERYLGSVHTLAAAATIHQFRCVNVSQLARFYRMLTTDACLTVLSAGTSGTFVAVSCANIMSPSTYSGNGTIQMNGTALNRLSTLLREPGSTLAQCSISGTPSSGLYLGGFNDAPIFNQSVEYSKGNGATTNVTLSFTEWIETLI